MRINRKQSVHKAGELAYVDSLFGFILVKVLEIKQNEDNELELKAVVTKSHHGYTKGSILTFTGSRLIEKVIPRCKVYTRFGGQYRICNNYSWITGE